MSSAEPTSHLIHFNEDKFLGPYWCWNLCRLLFLIRRVIIGY